MSHLNGKKKEIFFKFGKLEILVDGTMVEEIPIAKNGGERYYVKKPETLNIGIYQMNLEELKKQVLGRVKLKYGSIGSGRLSIGPKVEIIDKTYQSRERQYIKYKL